MTAEELIRLLDLRPLPVEGGFFRETWRSRESIPKSGLPTRYTGPRSFGTAIYYLLTPEAFSALHRLPGDEMFHFYLGDPVLMLQLHPDGRSEIVTIGPDIVHGEQVQIVVPAGTWQGTLLKAGGRFALLGTTMAPGYDPEDCELADPQRLIHDYPDRRDLILRLTQPR